jgi:hypothetical protein
MNPLNDPAIRCWPAGLRIIALSVGCAVAYGIVHDQVTLRISLEYFTVAHPPLFLHASPTLLGLVWGVLATWWFGGLLGLVLSGACLRGTRPEMHARSLLRPLAILCVCCAGAELLAGAIGYALVRSGNVTLAPRWAERVPTASHARFMAVMCAHSTGYAVAVLGGLGLCAAVWRWRARATRQDWSPIRDPSPKRAPLEPRDGGVA